MYVFIFMYVFINEYPSQSSFVPEIMDDVVLASNQSLDISKHRLLYKEMVGPQKNRIIPEDFKGLQR